MAHRLTGWTAIRYAERHDERDWRFHKYADPIEGARSDLDLSEAKSVAREDPRLIWLSVPSGKKKNPSRRGIAKRVSSKLMSYVRKLNPAGNRSKKRVTAVLVTKLKGGGVTIKPVRSVTRRVVRRRKRR